MATVVDNNKSEEQWIQELVENATYSRSQLLSRMMDPRRDIDDECGYGKTSSLTADIYQEMYDREPIARRVNDVLPLESWLTTPSIYEDEDVETTTQFEAAWEELGATLKGSGWSTREEGNPIWQYLLRTDRLSGIGAFGVLLLGLDDGLDLDLPAAGVDSQGRYQRSSGQTKLLYLRCFPASQVTVASIETDTANPRFGKPTQYTLSFATEDHSTRRPTSGLTLSAQTVHWTRIIHIADNLDSSEVYGVPRMQPVWNRLYDLKKLYAGSAEMYWRGAFPGFAFELAPELAGQGSIDVSTMRTQMEKYITGLQRYLTAEGMTVKSLAPQVVDPTPQINTQIEAICVQLAIPKRIFVGSERGELASSQDAGTWNNRLRARQDKYITPAIISPFVDRLIALGVLPEPKEYRIVWPDLESLTEQDQADIAVKRTEAIVKYVTGSGESLISPRDYLTRLLGMTEDEANEVLKATLKELAEQEEEPEYDETTTAPGSPPGSQRVPGGEDNSPTG